MGICGVKAEVGQQGKIGDRRRWEGTAGNGSQEKKNLHLKMPSSIQRYCMPSSNQYLAKV